MAILTLHGLSDQSCSTSHFFIPSHAAQHALAAGVELQWWSQWDLTFSQIVWLLGLLNCSSHKLQRGLTFGQIVWLLSMLNCSNCTKNIHEFGNITIGGVELQWWSRWDLTFSQIVWLLGLLNCSSHKLQV
eukprot:1160482-Pelagomonas_calceolata.AAC.7